jgi:peptidoglycan/LPS O-acetylase OafA/YrhL
MNPMNKELSTYLDLLRVGAAATVFMGHLSWMAISGGFLWQIQPFGHSAVVVFFVLSGFVIQYAADTKERTLYDFSVARLARLYSVVLPAIFLTLACDIIGTHHNPGIYDMAREPHAVQRLLMGMLFLTQSWGHMSLLSNEPFWSLPYEFWYYVIFAAATFLKGPQRVTALIVGAAIAGPAILLMGPIWAAGALAYRFAKRVTLKKSPARLLWAATGIAAVVVLRGNGALFLSSSPFLPAAFSGRDFLLGALVAVNIFSASFLSFGLSRIHAPAAKLAAMTFALYLFHVPLLHLAAAYVPARLPPPLRAAIEAGLVLSIIYALSFITEGQKRRWRAIFRWLLRPFGAPKSTESAA